MAGGSRLSGGNDWRGTERAQRSAAYNNRAAVPDSAQRLAGWQARSAALRAALPDHLALPYGPGPRQRYDLFRCGAARAPLLVFIHGGYWQRNGREDFSCMAEGALAHGLDVAVVGHTLAPEASLTAIAGEIDAALTHLHPRDAPVVVAGWSAGGHLAALAARRPDIDGALAISGIFDLAPLRDTVVDDALQLTEDEVAALSPMRLPGPRARQVVAYGANELPELCRQSRDYAAAARAAGQDAILVPLADADHFSVFDALISPDGELTRHAASLARGG